MRHEGRPFQRPVATSLSQDLIFFARSVATMPTPYATSCATRLSDSPGPSDSKALGKQPKIKCAS